ncbi:unnamed protein product [Medioppia subpectinata]|uniref:Uncharacterized protein n=1 Tax=Medioppia subpectinata TaxID=1979941 RepID=A0A7R9KF13_9ACAR|nr:unnamed protein product [Medioppia subpectinata]CAG2101983.1 unnamed protein product [Medioppia subpectinata]
MTFLVFAEGLRYSLLDNRFSFFETSQRFTINYNIMSSHRFVGLVALILALVMVFGMCDAGYRKPPFNGSAEEMMGICEAVVNLIPLCNPWISKINEANN